MSSTKRPRHTVQKLEMFLLVKGLLEDERDSFPQTLASFEQESRTVLAGAPRDRKGLLKLQDVLDEYLSLKAERQARADLTDAFRRDPSAGHPVTSVFENLMVLLDDYTTLREARPKRGRQVDHLGFGLQPLAADNASPVAAVHIPPVHSHPPAAPPHAAAPAPPAAPAPVYQAPASPLPCSSSATQPLDAGAGGEEGAGRQGKRRKGVPSKSKHGRVHGAEQPAGAAAAVAALMGALSSATGGGGAGLGGGGEGEGEGQYLDGLGNMYSDISENVLSDPQVSELMKETNIDELFGLLGVSELMKETNIDELFELLGDTDFSALVQPLTHHINAKLSEDAAVRTPTKSPYNAARFPPGASPVTTAPRKLSTSISPNNGNNGNNARSNSPCKALGEASFNTAPAPVPASLPAPAAQAAQAPQAQPSTPARQEGSERGAAGARECARGEGGGARAEDGHDGAPAGPAGMSPVEAGGARREGEGASRGVGGVPLPLVGVPAAFASPGAACTQGDKSGAGGGGGGGGTPLLFPPGVDMDMFLSNLHRD
ncbi:hypothetical protein T484DRAFT_1879516 [Baffinella frigidus]|nr:hypothetical protein T484DRAFT_1879516 [Cryptophyta sp. CCMP2293]